MPAPEKPFVDVRPSRWSDLEHLDAIERSAAGLFRGTHAEAVADGQTTHPLTFRRAHCAGLLWISAAQGKVAGFLLAEPCLEGLYIRELSVASSAQRKGHGSALVAAALEHAAREGMTCVLLTTDRTLAWNAPFYVRLGFQIVERDALPQTLRQRLARQNADGMGDDHRCGMALHL